jgi:hypothetical protein
MSNTAALEHGASPPRSPAAAPAAKTGRGLRGNPWLTLIAVALGVMMVSRDAMKDPVSQGAAPVEPGTPPEIAARISDAAHASFLDGMHLAFMIGAIAFACAITLALLVRSGERREGVASVHV